MCLLPIKYTIGDFDDRFGLSREQALASLTAAEAVWEDSLGRDDIFEYSENASLRVNFIYDERQRQTEQASSALDDLELRGDANEVLVELHRRLVEEYEKKEARYESLRVAYENKLNSYNTEVERYNKSGGAPSDEYDRLQETRVELDSDRNVINALGNEMNDLVDRINEIGDKGNELIQEYNNRIRRFNDTYAQEGELTQGDYRRQSINVYTFTDMNDLILVLAHEFGHSLALDHSEQKESIMYYLMGDQPVPLTLSEEDKADFSSACTASYGTRLLSGLKKLYNDVVNKK